MSVPLNDSPRQAAPPSWHEQFLQMLPVIQLTASVAFRQLKADAQQEAIQEVTANALAAFVRLVERGKADLAFPTVLASYGIAQYHSGRRVGTRLNVRDVSSEYCQRSKGLVMQQLHRYDPQEDEWRDIVVEDRTATPAEIVATKVDFSDWLDTLPRRQRRIAETLATGETTSRTARKFRVSAGRVSQLRRQLYEAWQEFQGELVNRPAMATA